MSIHITLGRNHGTLKAVWVTQVHNGIKHVSEWLKLSYMCIGFFQEDEIINICIRI